MALADKTVTNILEILDEKYLQTKSEKLEVLSQDLQSFKLSTEDTAESSWDKFCTLRTSLLKEEVISNTFFFNVYIKL